MGRPWHRSSSWSLFFVPKSGKNFLHTLPLSTFPFLPLHAQQYLPSHSPPALSTYTSGHRKGRPVHHYQGSSCFFPTPVGTAGSSCMRRWAQPRTVVFARRFYLSAPASRLARNTQEDQAGKSGKEGEPVQLPLLPSPGVPSSAHSSSSQPRLE